jgi:hypothetical protein
MGRLNGVRLVIRDPGVTGPPVGLLPTELHYQRDNLFYWNDGLLFRCKTTDKGINPGNVNYAEIRADEANKVGMLNIAKEPSPLALC